MSSPTIHRGLVLGILLLFLLMLAGPVEAADQELKRDDGAKVGKLSSAGTGHVVAFDSPKGNWWIRAVKVHGARYGVGYDTNATVFTVAICDENLQPLTSFQAPYSRFGMGMFGWKEIPLPRAFLAPERFKVVVAFAPTQKRGVYVGWANTQESHSSYGLPGGEERPFEADKEWMIRAVLAKKLPQGLAKETILGGDDGQKTGHKSIAGGGHVIHFKRPSGKWWIASVLVYAQRYGGGYDPEATPFKVSVASSRNEILREKTATYDAFGAEKFGWVEIPLHDPVQVPAKFRIVLDFDPAQTRGVFVGYGGSTDKRCESFVGRAGEKPRAFGDGTWMIRARLSSTKPLPPSVEEKRRDPKDYLEDFEFIRRTVSDNFPALEKKGVDWDAVCGEWKEKFENCRDDGTHVKNATQLLAVLGDMHTGVTKSEVKVKSRAFDGLYGAGLWIAREGHHYVLRAIMPNHELEGQIGPGALLVSIDGKPTLFAMQEVYAQVRKWSGWSSQHFLDARLSFQFFPFGKKKKLKVRFLNPGGGVVDVNLPRWGPGGRGLSRQAVTMPPGVEAKGHVVSHRLLPYVGYIRILGGMNDDTKAAFDDALERIKDVRALVLDCRGMGGGGDGPAWAMAGRFFTSSIPFKHAPVLKPSGSWQFEAPVVMLTDERMVSSAETFTWAMSETLRATTVGRPTGGATIIPKVFQVPSEIFEFRLGVNDRKTSGRGVQPEGIGTRPNIYIPYDGELLTVYADPILVAGFDVALMFALGAPRSMVVDTYSGVLNPDADSLHRAWAEWSGYPHHESLKMQDLTKDLVDNLIEVLAVELENEANQLPDAIDGAHRLNELWRVAHVLGRTKILQRAQDALGPIRKERQAQETFVMMIQKEGWPPGEQAVDDFWAAHEGTRWANVLVDTFPRAER